MTIRGLTRKMLRSIGLGMCHRPTAYGCPSPRWRLQPTPVFQVYSAFVSGGFDSNKTLTRSAKDEGDPRGRTRMPAWTGTTPHARAQRRHAL